MLYADRRALEKETKVLLLRVREKELNLYIQNCRSVGTGSALLGGLAYFGLVYTDQQYFQTSSEVSKWFYCMGITICMGTSLLVVLITTSITMLGPGLALRGPEGAYHDAVEGILDEFDKVLRLFSRAVLTCVLMVITYAWTEASVSWFCSVLVTTECFCVVWVIALQADKVRRTFPLKSWPIVSGAFERVVLDPRRPPRSAHYSLRPQPPPVEARMQSARFRPGPGHPRLSLEERLQQYCATTAARKTGRHAQRVALH